jgi:magnesium transporter
MRNTTCLVFRNDQPPQAIPLQDVSEYIHDASLFIWIELLDPDPGKLKQLGEELGMHELALEDALTTHQRPKLEEYSSHLFISAKTAELWENRVLFGEAHFFIGANFIAAVQHGRGLAFAQVRDRLASARNGLRPGSPLALYLVLDLIVDHYRPVLNSMSDRFHTLENVLLTDALDRADLEKLYNVKRELSLLRDAAEPMQDIVLDLIRLHPEFVTAPLKVYYRDVHDHSVRVTAAIDTLRSNASDAMQFHLASLTLRQNESVQKLAGWGAILAIPTVIFSLYGMNFDAMPELHLPWMYPAVLAGTAIASTWLYRHLKNRNWI